jgi:hypothetical protein
MSARRGRTRLERWFSSLSRGAKWLVGVAAAVGTIATAIAAVAGLWPDPPAEPAELGADLSHVSIDPSVTLDEYAVRQGAEVAWTPRGTAVFAADVVAQAETGGATIPEAGASGPEGDGDGPHGDGDFVLELRLSPEATARVKEGFLDALGDLPVDETQIGFSQCFVNLSGPTCGMSSEMGPGGIGVFEEDGSETEVSAATIADRMSLILAGTRTLLSDQGETQLLGAIVDFDITLRGFRDRRANVRWSLFDTGGGGPVPHEWLKGQVALWLEGQAQTDSGSGTFWVPLPKNEGPFFVRLGVYDEDGDRLDYEDTQSVR